MKEFWKKVYLEFHCFNDLVIVNLLYALWKLTINARTWRKISKIIIILLFIRLYLISSSCPLSSTKPTLNKSSLCHHNFFFLSKTTFLLTLHCLFVYLFVKQVSSDCIVRPPVHWQCEDPEVDIKWSSYKAGPTPVAVYRPTRGRHIASVYRPIRLRTQHCLR